MFKKLVLLIFLHPKTREFLNNSRFFKKIASKFIAGETFEDTVNIIRDLNARGIKVTLDFLGEEVTDLNDVVRVKHEYDQLIEKIKRIDLDADIAIKLSSFGIKKQKGLATLQAAHLADLASTYSTFVWVDMEDSTYTDITLETYSKIREQQAPIGIALQAYLKRTLKDIDNLLAVTPVIRLCKGAYKESDDVAFQSRKEIDENYVRLARSLLLSAKSGKCYPAIATHNPKLIEKILVIATEFGVSPTLFEFQMLYGIKPNLAQMLADHGYQVRIYIPYGTYAYPYFVRRLAERPANMIFLLKNLFN